jgi:hypothetical protein
MQIHRNETGCRTAGRRHLIRAKQAVLVKIMSARSAGLNAISATRKRECFKCPPRV